MTTVVLEQHLRTFASSPMHHRHSKNWTWFILNHNSIQNVLSLPFWLLPHVLKSHLQCRWPQISLFCLFILNFFDKGWGLCSRSLDFVLAILIFWIGRITFFWNWFFFEIILVVFWYPSQLFWLPFVNFAEIVDFWNELREFWIINRRTLFSKL